MRQIETPLMQPVTAVLLVALDDELAKRCAAAIAPIACLRVSHVIAALERMLVLRPLAIVVDRATEDDLGELGERARDVGSVVVVVDANDATTLDDLRAAVVQADIDRARR